jgi:NAD+ synthase (glutamine-hydrolysing)
MKHGLVKIMLATPPVVAGDIQHNTREIVRMIDIAREQCAELLVLGLDSLTGGNCRDLAHNHSFLERAKRALDEIRQYTATLQCIVIVGTPHPKAGGVANCVAVLHKGNISVVDVDSYYMSANIFTVSFDVPDKSATIIKDSFCFGILGAYDNPRSTLDIVKYSTLQANGCCDIVFDMRTCPTTFDRHNRCSMSVAAVADSLNIAVVYISSGSSHRSTGAYSGDKVVAQAGKLLTCTQTAECIFADIDYQAIAHARKAYTPSGKYTVDNPGSILHLEHGCGQHSRYTNRTPTVPQSGHALDNVIDILCAGILQRVRHVGASGVVVGVSGGLDSAWVLLLSSYLATKSALGTVYAVTLHADATSARSKRNAAALIAACGAHHIDINIQSAVQAHLQSLQHTRQDIVYENAFARERAQILQGLANKHKALHLGTGDMSEIALGWSTYGGDQLAHLNPNSNLTKTAIRALLPHLASIYDKLCGTTLSKTVSDIVAAPISPELKPKQDTESLLAPYELLDYIMYRMLSNGFDKDKVAYLCARTFPEHTPQVIDQAIALFCTRFVRNQFKRNASCDGIRVSDFDINELSIPSDLSQAVM